MHKYLTLFAILIACVVGLKTKVEPIRLPESLKNIKLPHAFSQAEMEAIRSRLRAFSLELAMFQVSLPMMSDMQKQRNYANAAWPIMQCLIGNQDEVLERDQPPKPCNQPN